jgi:hypothetical protein
MKGLVLGLYNTAALTTALRPTTLTPLEDRLKQLEDFMQPSHCFRDDSLVYEPQANPIHLSVLVATIVVKEWLFQASTSLPQTALMSAKKVALETNSSILLANVAPLMIVTYSRDGILA